MAAANNVTRILDARKFTYTAFEIPAVKLFAIEVSDHLHMLPENVYKTSSFAGKKAES